MKDAYPARDELEETHVIEAAHRFKESSVIG
jgi:hypothetical protein